MPTLPSALPKVVVRAEPERVEAWQRHALSSGRSFSAWAGEVLDAAVGGGMAPEDTQPRRSQPAARVCVRAVWHRPGIFCKECGDTPS